MKGCLDFNMGRMKGRIFLDGGGDGERSAVVYREFLKGVERVAYVPLAWASGNYGECFSWVVDALGMHKKVEIEMFTDLRGVELEGFDGVFIGGGNTFKLLKAIKESRFDKKLIEFYEKDGSIIGGSAGALIFGCDIGTATLGDYKDKNKVKLRDLNGLNFVEGCDIQAHFVKEVVEECREHVKKTGRRIIGIPEGSALLISGEVYKVVGESAVILIDEVGSKSFNVGERMEL